MAGNSLAEEQSGQADRIAEEIARQSIAHQQALQTGAVRKWQEAHEALAQIVSILDQDYYDSCQKSGHPVERFDDQTLHHWIGMRIKALQYRLSQMMRLDQTEDLQRQLEDAGREVEASGREGERLRTMVEELQAENKRLNTSLQAIQQAQRPVDLSQVEPLEHGPTPQAAVERPDGEAVEPDWMRDWWVSRTFAKESAAVILMGETGKALRPTLISLLARKLNGAPSSSGLSEVFDRLASFDAEGGLIEAMNVFDEPGAGGNHPVILRLTERGRMAYRLLTGKQAVENEYERLLQRYQSPEQTVLVIQASVALVELGGYQLKEQAPEVRLPDGSGFTPELMMLDQKTDEILYVSVEIDANQDRMARAQKWKHLLEANQGDLYVVCENARCQQAVQAEINQAIGSNRFNSHLTNLDSLRKGVRAQDGGVWLSARKAR